MKLKKIDINGFGKFEDRLFLLKPGMNVFYGCNESGKSTLQSFIKGMFFGLKGGRKSKDGTLPSAKQYKPWVAKTYGGILEYELDNGENYTITRNFDRNTISIYDQFSNNITGKFPAGREEGVKFAEQHLGLSESCFERTVFIGQMQSVINNEGKKVIAERLTNIKQTGDEEVSFRKAVSVLKEAQLSYVGSERTTTRPINIINSQLQEAIEEEQEYIKLHESCMDMFLELGELQQKETEIKKQLTQLNHLKAKLVKKQEAEKLEKMCLSLDGCYRQLADIENKINAKREELDATLVKLKEYEIFRNYSRNDSDEMVSDYTNYKLLSKDLEEYELEERDIEERIEKLQKEVQQYSLFEYDKARMDEVIQDVLQYNRVQISSVSAKEKQPSGVKKYVPLAGLLAGIVILILSFMLEPFSAVVTAAGLFVSCLSSVFFISAVKHSNVRKEEIAQKVLQAQKHQQKLDLLNDWMEQVKVDNIHDFIRLKNMFEDKKKQLDELTIKRQKHTNSKNNILTSREEFRGRILSKLTSANIATDSGFEEEDIQKWKSGIDTCSTLIQEVKEKEAALSSLNQNRESLYREVSVITGTKISSLSELEMQIRNKRSQLESLKPESKDDTYICEDLTIDGAELKIKKLNEELSQVTLAINTLATRLENTPDGEMIQKTHEKVQKLTEEKQKKIALGKALETAVEVLTEASVEIQRNYSPYLNEAMGNIIDTITGGRYKDVMADDSLKLNIQPPDTAEKVIPEQLSSGTADQVYFALRLATVMLVEKDGETLPLFLDEPFVQYDEERTKNALLLLHKESDTRQIILFTCKEREVDLVRQVFNDKEINIVNL